MTSDFLTEAFLALRGRWKSEDTLQDAFCRLWGGKYKVGSVREAVGLLSRTGRNLEIDEFRKAERHPRQVSIDGRQIEDEGSDAAEREALFRKVEASVDSELTDSRSLSSESTNTKGNPSSASPNTLECGRRRSGCTSQEQERF